MNDNKKLTRGNKKQKTSREKQLEFNDKNKSLVIAAVFGPSIDMGPSYVAATAAFTNKDETKLLNSFFKRPLGNFV